MFSDSLLGRRPPSGCITPGVFNLPAANAHELCYGRKNEEQPGLERSEKVTKGHEQMH